MLEELAGGRLAQHVVAHRRRRGRSAGAAPPPSAGWAGTGSRARRRRRPGGRACSRRTRPASACRRRGRSSPNRPTMRSWSSWTLRFGGVDDDVGLGPHRLEQRPLPLDGLGQALAGDEQRVAPAGALVAPDEHLGAGLQVELPHAGAGRPQGGRGSGSSSAWRAPAPTTSATRGVSEPGARTSSTTFGMSSVGRLSMTNQPRSSRSSAAWERPAPDNPVMITNSLMAVGCFSQRRKRRRGMVAAASYSAARARKPGGGAGSSMRLQRQPGVGERVHVPGQRPVDEGDEHALLHLLDRLVLDEVGTDPPVLLGRVEHLVVDPAAVRASGAAGGSGRRGSARRAPAPVPPRAMAASTSRMCSNTRQATTASKRTGRRTAAPPAPARP